MFPQPNHYSIKQRPPSGLAGRGNALNGSVDQWSNNIYIYVSMY